MLYPIVEDRLLSYEKLFYLVRFVAALNPEMHDELSRVLRPIVSTKPQWIL